MFFRDKDGNSYESDYSEFKDKKEKEEYEYEKREIKIIMNRQEQIAEFKSPSYYIQIRGVKKWRKDEYDKLLKNVKVSFTTNHPELTLTVDVKRIQRVKSVLVWQSSHLSVFCLV